MNDKKSEKRKKNTSGTVSGHVPRAVLKKSGQGHKYMSVPCPGSDFEEGQTDTNICLSVRDKGQDTYIYKYMSVLSLVREWGDSEQGGR